MPNMENDPREDEGRTRQMPRVRTRRKSTSSTLVYVLFVIGISTLLAAFGWVVANDVFALNKPERAAVITVTEDEPFSQVVSDLKSSGMIQFKSMFNIFAGISNAADKVVAGTYELNTNMDYRAIVTNLGSRSASRMVVPVTIPEGFTLEQIFARLVENGVSSDAKLRDMAANYDYAFSFLADLPLGNASRLEGYLFPDTYDFYMGEDAKLVLNKMLANYDRKFSEDMRIKAESNGYTMHQTLIIASMIEKETDGTDQSTIASVIYNRLTHENSGTNGFLQVDATLQYVLPAGQLVTQADYANLDSPFNTYLHKGLPPGPIANPGLVALEAALNPSSTNYYYYKLGKDKVHHFFNSYSSFTQFDG